MVLNAFEIRNARNIRGNSSQYQRAFAESLNTTNFITQVACHRQVQGALHVLISRLYNKNRSREYRFNCIVVHNSWRFTMVCSPKLITHQFTNLFLPFQCGVVRGLGLGHNRGHLLQIAAQIQRVPQQRRQRPQQAAQQHQHAAGLSQQVAQRHQQGSQRHQQAAQPGQQAAQPNKGNLLQAAALKIIPQQGKTNEEKNERPIILEA
jgi:hypothetical protein